jgi:hypothetical protein
MRLDQVAESTFRVLDKCSGDLRQQAPWHWTAAVQNGTLLPIESRFDEGFLQLASRPEMLKRSAQELERALLGNRALPGGAGLALGADGTCLQIRADIALPIDTSFDEQHLLKRMRWALDGFHHGVDLLNSLDAEAAAQMPPPESGSDSGLAELLRESSWKCAARGPNDFSAMLDAETEPSARIRMSENCLLLSVELGRVDTAAAVAREALAVFLLTAGGAMRMAHAWAMEKDDGWSFGFRVCLPAAPAPEEIDHALAALSIAHRATARESRMLLDEATARCYLASRTNPTTN